MENAPMDLEQMLLSNMTQPQAQEALGRGTAIVVTGSIEQHGGHLPLGTDAIAALTIALRVGLRLEAPVLPLSPVGVAPYHLHWPGSLTIRPDTLGELMLDVCDGLAAAGVERVIVVNWHEGNSPAIRIAADRVQAKLPVRVIVAEAHVITNGLFPDEMEFTHAGAMETAAVLAHAPSLVRLQERTESEVVDRGIEGHALFRRRDVFPVMKDFREVATAGWYGTPDTITETRAREIIDAVADHIVSSVEDVWKSLTERTPNTEDPTRGMSTMRAAVLRDWNDLAVEEVDIPLPGPGEVQLRVRACGLCGTDLKMVQGKFQQRGWPPSLPFVMGHEWSGEVVAIGEGLDDLQLKAGDKVVAENHVGCGRCPMCRFGRYNLCEKSGTPGYRLYGHTAPGALAEYAVRPAEMLHKLPDSVSPLEGALVNQGALTVHGLRRVGFLPGSTLAIFGPGLLGLLSAAIASASGASQIIMVGRGNRLDLATKMGCDGVVDYEEEDPVAGIRRLSAGRGVDYVFDCTGNPAVPAQALGAVRRGGRVAMLGLTGGKPSAIDVDRLTLDEIDLMGIRSSPNAYPAMIALMRSGKVDLSPLLTHVYPLEAVGEALAALESRQAVRPIVEM